MSDFGVSSKPPNKGRARAFIIAAAVLAVAGVAFLLWSNQDSRRRAIEGATATIKAEAVQGAPCAPGTPEGKLGRGDQWLTATFTEVQFGRRIGHMDCAVAEDKAAPDGYRSVCQFSSPAELKVVTKAGTATYFDLGLGVPATVIVAGEKVSCVLPGKS